LTARQDAYALKQISSEPFHGQPGTGKPIKWQLKQLSDENNTFLAKVFIHARGRTSHRAGRANVPPDFDARGRE